VASSGGTWQAGASSLETDFQQSQDRTESRSGMAIPDRQDTVISRSMSMSMSM
jgi:hypothetical protein